MKIKMVEPKLDDLGFRAGLLADEDTMSYNHAWGGTIEWPKQEWKDWYDYWIINHENKRFYRYLFDEEAGKYVGEIAYHFDDEQEINVANVIIMAKYRGQGYGNIGLKLLCDSAKENGVDILYDDIALDNPGIALFLKNGFSEEFRTAEIIMLKKIL